MGFLSSVGKIGKSVFDAGKKVFQIGNAFSGSNLGGLVGDGISTAAQVAATKYGYDKSYQGIQEQNATAKQIADQANISEANIANQYNQNTRQIAQEANAASSAQALRQMQFQAIMSNTAHQREAQDLKKAGLNRILSGTGGMGASSPAGAQGTVQMAPQTKANVHRAPVANTGAAVASAMDVFRTMASVMKTNAERDYIKEVKTPQARAETEKTRGDTLDSGVATAKARAETRAAISRSIESLESADLKKLSQKLVQADIINTDQHTKLLTMTTRQAKAELERMLQDEKIYSSEYGTILRIIEKLTPTAGKIPSVILKKGR